MRDKGMLFNLLAQIAFGMILMSLCLPSLQNWAQTFQASQAHVQLTFSGYVIALGIMQLIYGPCSDRWGRKPVLMAGLALACAGSALAVFATGLDALIAARVLQGAGASAGLVVGRAMVQDMYHGPERTRTMAYVGMAMGVSPPLATLVGGQIHQHLGWQANFVLATLLGVLLLLTAYLGLPQANPKECVHSRGFKDMASAYKLLFAHRPFVLYVSILAFTYATLYAYLSGAPVVLASYNVGPTDVGWYIACMTAAYITGSYTTSRLVHRRGERWVMFWGQVSVLSGVSLLLGLALIGMQARSAIAVPVLLIGLGHGLLVPSALAGSIGQLPALAGAAAAVAGLMQQLMGAVGSYSVGLFTHENAAPLGWLMLLFSACALVAQWLLNIHQSHRQSQDIKLDQPTA